MTTTKAVEIDGVRYIPESEARDLSDSPIRIVIAQRGWVFVGRYREDGERVHLADARVIRKWGTSRGLGELVDGPLTDTVLDPAGDVTLHVLGVVATIACDGSKWDL